MRISLKVDSEDAERLLHEAPDVFGRVGTKWAQLGSQLVRNQMIHEIHGRTRSGRSKSIAPSVQAQVSGMSATIGPTKEAAVFVDQPTRPHVIRPRNAKTLAFPRAGGVRAIRGGLGVTKFTFGGKTTTTGLVFAQLVHHPGTKGLHFIQHTAENVDGPLIQLFEELVAATLKELDRGAS